MSNEHENFGGEIIHERRTCTQHSGIETKQTIFNWLLGILILSILGNAALLQSVRDALSDIRVEIAGVKSDKNTANEVHQRLNERITTLDRRMDSIQERR